MESEWKRRRILIRGKTRPELSQKYRETVCTGGVFEDSKKLVRLYPIPLRYIDSESVFKKYQWIEAFVTKPKNDSRPESFRIRYDGIETGEILSTKDNWRERAKWILQSENIVQSVEEIQLRQSTDGTSLGLMKPLEIIDVVVEPFAKQEKEEFWSRYKSMVNEMELPLDEESGREIKPICPPDYRFKVRFRCDDPRCAKPHTFNILDWEVDALYFNLHRRREMSPQQSADKVKQKLKDSLDLSKNDVYFFLGNISSHPDKFTIVGLWHPKKQIVTPKIDQSEFAFS